jgi:hypothetical protein
VTSRALSAHLLTAPASPLHQSLLPPQPPLAQTPLIPSLLDLPNVRHPIPLLQSSQLTFSYRLPRKQHHQPCPQPLLHPHPSPPHLLLGSFSNDSASYTKEFKYLTQLFSALILFPNPSLVFKKNLNRQRMALKPPREIL